MTIMAFKFLLTFLITTIISGVIREIWNEDNVLRKYIIYPSIGVIVSSVGFIISGLALLWLV